MENNTKSTKKNRCQNWLDDEKNVLLKLIQRYVKDVENKNTDSNTNQKKRETWQIICDSFNAMVHRQGPPRTVAQLKTQWSIVKMKMKRILTQERQLLMKPGNGMQTSLRSKDDNYVLSWLPNEFDIDTSSDYDESKIVITPDIMLCNPNEDLAAVHVKQETASPECQSPSSVDHNQTDSMSLDDNIIINVEVPTPITRIPRTSPDNSTIHNVQGQHAPPFKRRKLMHRDRKTTAAEAAHHMATLVNLDRKMKLDIHEMQMKNENLKYEIRLLKLKYWKKKLASLDGPVQNTEMNGNSSSE